MKPSKFYWASGVLCLIASLALIARSDPNGTVMWGVLLIISHILFSRARFEELAERFGLDE